VGDELDTSLPGVNVAAEFRSERDGTFQEKCSDVLVLVSSGVPERFVDGCALIGVVGGARTQPPTIIETRANALEIT
jgi:hypothetical protein